MNAPRRTPIDRTALMLTPAPVSAEQLLALRVFCECAYQPSDARVQAVLAHDWTSLGRIAEPLAALPVPVTREALCEVARTVLHQAVQDLEPCFPPRPGAVNALEVFRLHVLEQISWSALEQQLLEEGRPHARGTLIRRQHELLPYLAEWARTDRIVGAKAIESAQPVIGMQSNGASSDESVVPSDAGARATRRAHRFPMAWWVPTIAILVLVIAVAFTLWGPRRPADGRRPLQSPREIATRLAALDGTRIGRYFLWNIGDATLPEPYPPIAIPEPRGQRNLGMLIEYAPGRTGLLVPLRNTKLGPARMTLWDPVEERVVWEYAYTPPREERITHATVGPEVLDELYEVIRVFHAGPEGTLGDHLVVVNRQTYSPLFVTFVEVATGEVIGRYVHPGFLEVGIVYDIDGDGRMEAVLGGTDNAVNRPVLVALRPGPGRSAASTVSWNESREEGAVARLLLPHATEALGPASTLRLTVVDAYERFLDLSTRTLTVGVGFHARPMPSLYHARVGPGLRPDPVMSLVLWDEDVVELNRLGIDPALSEGWMGDFEHLEPES